MMDKARRFVQQDQLMGVVRAAFGSAYHLHTVERLQGGSKKGVYRLAFDDESTAILYVWDAEENYWPTTRDSLGDDRTDPFSEASGLDLFEASHACLDAIGVRTPQVYFLDPNHVHFPADIAVIEDVQGGTLEEILQHDPQSAERTLAQLRTALQAMQQHRGKCIGKIALVNSGDVRQVRSCEQIVLDRAIQHLAEAASRDERMSQARERLEEKLHELVSAIHPRDEYSLIHGELGPDHVLVDERRDPVIIDIEGVMFFDVEWEHVFLRLRFGQHYHWLHADNLDEQRMQLYALAMSLSLVAGPLRLLDGDYPEREFMMEVAESHIQRALTFLR